MPSHRFGPFLLDVRERRLLRADVVVPLAPKAFDTLAYLVERAGRLVSKDELMAAVWSEAWVEDGNLSRVVHVLRKTLGGDGDGRDLIETVPKQGYRFVAPVTVVEAMPTVAGVTPPSEPLVPDAPTEVARGRPRRLAAAAGLVTGAVALAGLLAFSVLRDGVDASAQVQTPSGEAYNEFREGRLHLERQRDGDYDPALRHFERALELDPRFAAAHAGKADASIFRYWETGAHDDIAQARQAIDQALRIDAGNSYAHTVSCRIRAVYDWQFAAAEAECRRAVALDPRDHEARRELAFLLNSLGRKAEALREMETAIALAPTSFNKRSRGVLLYFAGRLDEAIAELRQIEATDPEFLESSRWLARCYEQTGDHANALEALLRGRDPVELDREDEIRAAFAAGGWPAVLRATLPLRPDARLETAESQTQLGERDAALATLERMIEARRVMIVHVAGDPRLAPLRADPRFAALLSRVGVPH